MINAFCFRTRRAIFVLCVLAASGVATLQPSLAGPYADYATALATAPPAGSEYRPDLERKLFDMANAYRREKGKPPLTDSEEFRTAARAHAADMMLNGFVGHRASTGQSFESRMRALVGDVTRYPALGENAARETRDTPVDDAKADALFRQWLESSAHAKALRRLDYAFVSTGVIQRGNKIWAVQIFWSTPRQKGIFQ